MASNDDIKNILDGEEIPFNPQHWEQLKARLDASAPSPFEEKAKDILGSGEVAMPADAWEQFEQKMNAPTPFEKAAKEKLDNASVAYNNEHWNNISERLNETATPFEKKAREILNSNDASFSANHWQKMEAMLNEQGDNKGGFFTWKKVAAAAAVLFLSWATYAVVSNSIDNKTAEENNRSEKSAVAINDSRDKNSDINNSNNTNKEIVKSADAKSAQEKSGQKNDNNIFDNSVNKVQKNNNVSSIAVGKRPKHKNKKYTYNTVPSGEQFVKEDKPQSNDPSVSNEIYLEDNSQLAAIATSAKNTIIKNDDLGSVVNATEAPDFDGQVFKYLSLPSSLPSSFLTNLWDNPAVAGLEKSAAVKVMYNTGWTDKMLRGTATKKMYLENPTNYYVSADAALGKHNQFGVGAYYQRNDNNNWESDNINVSLSYNKMLSKFTLLKAGVGVTYCNNAVNTSNISFWEKSTTGGLLSTNDAAMEAPERYLNYNAGVWVSHPLFFGGITVNNIAQNTFTKRPELEVSTNVTGGLNIPFSKKFTTTVYAQRQSNIVALWTVGAMMSFNNKIFGGFSYENSNFAAFTFGMNIADRLRVHINGGILAQKESLYLGTEKEGFIQGGVRYLLTENKKQNKY